jgi:hypothetical protein
MQNESRDPSLLAVGALLLMIALTKKGMGCCEGASAYHPRVYRLEAEEEPKLELSRHVILYPKICFWQTERASRS